ncbi:class I SAM-dependent methyltransferase, partial [Burkholderia cenocepacia]|uniref:class I SAM-dependent methyltransferase n=1 Tax=Burkholderia cenocepacia TaxID=95486 RepID=UPI0038CC0BC9
PMLRRYGRLTCLEPSELGRRLTRETVDGDLDLRDGLWPHASGLAPDERFDLIAMLDVLEHVDDPAAALAEVRARLAPGGRLVVTVPAYRWMWSAHDRMLHHRTRYTMRGLRSELEDAGLRVDALSGFNAVLLPAAIAARGAFTLLRVDRSPGSAVPVPLVNRALGAAFAAEVPLVARGARLPFGLSVLAVSSVA